MERLIAKEKGEDTDRFTILVFFLVNLLGIFLKILLLCAKAPMELVWV